MAASIQTRDCGEVLLNVSGGAAAHMCYLGQLGEVGHEIEVDAVRGPLQRHAAEEEDRQQEVGEEGGEVNNLQ